MTTSTATAASIGIGRRVWRQPLAQLAALLLAALAGLVVAAPLIAFALGTDPATIDLLARHGGPSLGHPLGTDELGRDLLLRLLEGGRVSLLVGLLGALSSTAIGVIVGLWAGWQGGRIDAFFMRLTDLVIALPLLPLLIVLAAVDLAKLGLPLERGQSGAADIARIVVLMALFGWTTVARLVRASVQSLKVQDFVLAARALGAHPLSILLRHVLPNTSSPILVAATLSIGHIILGESVLSFLGLGIQPPVASWGNMLTGAQELIHEAPALALWPGLLIFLTVVSFNLLGDALTSATNPRDDAI